MEESFSIKQSDIKFLERIAYLLHDLELNIPLVTFVN